jgi:hypothetical protein
MVRTGSARSLAATGDGGARKGGQAGLTRRNEKFRELGGTLVLQAMVV